ncbi:bifunctional 4-hydroxy-2-oxoglutarate aldolase/2-dehydro-3-deoxy-phosphogluconate aldolase [Chryseobacterium shigense]|uniref:2-dehydro-3-deoxyphosphogluconate aldolase / (4S)-4-hydroxy-2-oxoglutarate aldolase n=1 Tax=Chryseobacterium shigense TaxID=297244 RepID=A0A1N7I063_9FLAO|nr:bifunctional 4-hydroxy-2-oxoglutarate aldolase/2-dehydro-3-deoxy-phosphogluconate aldolase [Chryseobacterium shigense]PQA97831.1 bifunctional 4-hydroxy-2-oxoglutarate aldolase/2-dehydro-3-deoxy-phosphogluconate aldolase [Chryseobacterium shigense]SIS30408.1 2-dehydro-3-deoxyphosphogluconate aldolase / (4S)-4-hydroxy-2-oxoglutarate aldolase [Chryseobacterium shigense]
MARFTRIEVALKVKETGIVPVFYHADAEIGKNILKACYDGGACVFEFTNRGDFAHEVFAELVKYSAKKLPEMILGVGSVVDAGTASLYIQNGTNFIVAPVLNPEVAKVCNRRKISWMPGCGSVSEISYAEELGAEIVKIFPATQVGGPEFIKAVKGPMPWSHIMPTGGVSPTKENLSQWISAGAYCVGLGSQLFVKNENGEYDYEKITETVANSIQIIKELRLSV